LVILWGRSTTNLLRALLRGLNRIELDSLTRVAEGVTGLVLVVVLLGAFRSVMSAAVGLAVASALTLIGSLWLVSHVVRGAYVLDQRLIVRLVRAAVPVGVASSIQQLYWKLAPLLLSVLRPVADVGLFSAAFSTVVLSYGVSLAVVSSVFPTLSALALRDASRFRQVVEDGLRYMSAMSLPVGGLMILLSAQIMVLLYGAAFIEAADAVAVLGLMVPLMFARVFFWGALVAVGKQNLLIPAVLVSLTAMLMLCFVLIPPLDIVGAAIANLVGEACMVVLLGWFLSGQVSPIGMIRASASPLFATAISVACLWLLRPHLDGWLLVLLGTFVYCAVLLATKGIRPRELSSVMFGLSRIHGQIHARR
ncbi:MAG: oligosaccharide flippase family protein, partial [Anaerolineae bacterium]